MFTLQNKTILVTGASSGIGRATAIMIASQGANVILTGRNKDKLEEVSKILNDDKHLALALDLADEEAIQQLSTAVGKIDGLVHCAGIIDYTLFKNLNREKYDQMFDINFYSGLQLTNLLLKNKNINKGASLVYISSISSMFGVPATALYAASKAALNAAIKVLATEVAPRKIRANTIMPGIVMTPMIDNASGMIDSESFSNAEHAYPLGLGTPEDVACACVFLLSAESRWITGTSLLLDGGYSLI